MSERIELFDTTLRDGAQTPDVTMTSDNKARIAERLDTMGFAYIEGGWPEANPTDSEFFREIRGHRFDHAQIVAFGMTGRLGVKAKDDPGLEMLLRSETSVITIFGKSWMLHVEEVLTGTGEQNLESIFESVKYLREQRKRVFYDAEHFFDGFKENRKYALNTLMAARRAGAEAVILCDTNGGGTPEEIFEATIAVRKKIGEPSPLGIHVHNDAGLAVATTLAAIKAGATQVQGTVNGLGERSGNVDWCTFLPTAEDKYGIDTGIDLSKITSLARFVEMETGLLIPVNHPYVGENAFTHKAGVHVDAMRKHPEAYQHIKPERVGQVTSFEHSDQGGGANVLEIAQKWGYKLNKKDPRVARMVEEMKRLKALGDAQEFLMLYRVLEDGNDIFELHSETSVQIARDGIHLANVVVSFDSGDPEEAPISYSERAGVGAFDAFARGLNLLLQSRFPIVREIELLDYMVTTAQRQVKAGTGAEVEIHMEFGLNGERWTSIRRNVDEQIANQDAYVDGLKYFILKRKLDRKRAIDNRRRETVD